MDGVEATRLIAGDAATADIAVLVLTTFFEIDEHVEAAIRAGAAGFVGKEIEPDELLSAIRRVATGDPALSAVAGRTLIERLRAGGPAASRALDDLGDFDVLTPREREIVILAAEGRNNQDIARELTISVLTAKTHINRAMAKVGARDRAQLVAHAHTSGLLRGP
ncbi:LuxR C-terminal-related transcriptional regulator [Gordonia rhizosphera]|uniref:Putative two-component response regulator n=1 Tax=Gordonia rhizosphera NBRC 16068 TaxID=1108045 RepID=K6WNT3_9ACTN|nr:response regulator transcription factor [Gordonia rhizosphera]GAB88194.1 putative two-component response regulator [Gordonia rhizosphera NBRC 16068]